MPQSLASRLFGGISLSGILLVVVALQELILVPVYLLHWGPAIYRDWVVMAAMAEFLALLDLGMQVYFGNVLMQRYSSGDIKGYRKVQAEAAGVYLGLVLIGMTVVGAFFAFSGESVRTDLLGVDDPETLAGFHWLALGVVFRLPLGLFVGAYRARGEPQRAVIFSLVQTVSRIAVIAIPILLGVGPEGVAIAVVVQGLAMAAVALWDQRARYDEHWPRPTLPEPGALKTALALGGGYNLHALAVTLNVQGMVLVVSHLAVDSLSLIVFTTMRTLTGLGPQVGVQLAAMVGIEQSREQGAGRAENLLRLHRFVLRLSAAVTGAVAGLLLVVGPDLVAVWTHGKIEFDSALALAFLVAGMLSAPMRAAGHLFKFTNRPAVLVWSFSLQALIALSVAFVLVPRLGVLGAGLALVIADLVSMVGLMGARVARAVGDHWPRQTLVSLAFNSGFLIAALLFAGGAHHLLGGGSWWRVIVVSFLCASACLPLAWFFALEARERQRFRDIVPGFRREG